MMLVLGRRFLLWSCCISIHLDHHFVLNQTRNLIQISIRGIHILAQRISGRLTTRQYMMPARTCMGLILISIPIFSAMALQSRSYRIKGITRSLKPGSAESSMEQAAVQMLSCCIVFPRLILCLARIVEIHMLTNLYRISALHA